MQGIFQWAQKNAYCIKSHYDAKGPMAPFQQTSKYSRLPLSRTRLFRITAYLEVKIWSLF